VFRKPLLSFDGFLSVDFRRGQAIFSRSEESPRPRRVDDSRLLLRPERRAFFRRPPPRDAVARLEDQIVTNCRRGQVHGRVFRDDSFRSRLMRRARRRPVAEPPASRRSERIRAGRAHAAAPHGGGSTGSVYPPVVSRDAGRPGRELLGAHAVRASGRLGRSLRPWSHPMVSAGRQLRLLQAQCRCVFASLCIPLNSGMSADLSLLPRFHCARFLIFHFLAPATALDSGRTPRIPGPGSA